MARVSGQQPWPWPWLLKLGPRKTGVAVVVAMSVIGVGFLVAAIVRAHGASGFFALGAGLAAGALAVPLLMWLGKRMARGRSTWATFWAILAVVLSTGFLPEPATVAALAMAAGFFLTFAPIYMALARAHRTEIEARWASWQD